MSGPTVRDAIARQLWTLFWLCLAAVAAAFAGKLLLPTVAWRVGFAGALVAVLLVAYAVIARRARCPRCGHVFALATLARIGPFAEPHRRLDACPHCALALDTPAADAARAAPG
jgi:hypothetical protein